MKYMKSYDMIRIFNCFIPAMEISSTKRRAIGGIGYNITCGLGIMIMGAVASVFTDWKSFQIAASLTFIPFIIFGMFVPESPRYEFSTVL